MSKLVKVKVVSAFDRGVEAGGRVDQRGASASALDNQRVG